VVAAHAAGSRSSGMDLLCLLIALLFFAACEFFVARVADRL
jgi:hypothetical protein